MPVALSLRLNKAQPSPDQHRDFSARLTQHVEHSSRRLLPQTGTSVCTKHRILDYTSGSAAAVQDVHKDCSPRPAVLNTQTLHTHISSHLARQLARAPLRPVARLWG